MPPTCRFPAGLAIASLLLAALFSGCFSRTAEQVSDAPEDSTAPTSPTSCSIAVIDLDRVARGIGAVEKIRDAVAQFERKCVVELRQTTADLFGDHQPSGESISEFDAATAPLVANLSADQQREFNKTLRAAQSLLVVREQRLRDDFLNEVRPYAYQIARQQGCQLVLTTDQVYVAAEQVDITTPVIRRICEINAAAPAEASLTSADENQPIPKLASGGSFKME
jgi:Skp family chaperone for outer membrane proteins